MIERETGKTASFSTGIGILYIYDNFDQSIGGNPAFQLIFLNNGRQTGLAYFCCLLIADSNSEDIKTKCTLIKLYNTKVVKL